MRILKSGRINLDALIGGTYSIEQAQSAFDKLKSGTLNGVAVLIAYDTSKEPNRERTLVAHPRKKKGGKIGISIVGCGNHVLWQAPTAHTRHV